MKQFEPRRWRRLLSREGLAERSGTVLKWAAATLTAAVVSAVVGLVIFREEAPGVLTVSPLTPSEASVFSQSACAASMTARQRVSVVYGSPFVGRLNVDYSSGSGGEARIEGGYLRVVGYEPPPLDADCIVEISESRSVNIGNAGDPLPVATPRFSALSPRYLNAEVQAAAGFQSRRSPLLERSSSDARPNPGTASGGPLGGNPLGGSLTGARDAPVEYSLAAGESVAIDIRVSFDRAGTYRLAPVLEVRHEGEDRVLEGPVFNVSISTTTRR